MAAEVAGMWPLVRVCAHVQLEDRVAAEGLPTARAREGPRARVRPQLVPFQAGQLRETHPTFCADELRLCLWLGGPSGRFGL